MSSSSSSYDEIPSSNKKEMERLQEAEADLHGAVAREEEAKRAAAVAEMNAKAAADAEKNAKEKIDVANLAQSAAAAAYVSAANAYLSAAADYQKAFALLKDKEAKVADDALADAEKVAHLSAQTKAKAEATAEAKEEAKFAEEHMKSFFFPCVTEAWELSLIHI